MKIPLEFQELEKGYDFSQAFAEANRCLLCHDPPCSKGCPGGTDPGTFIRKFRMRNVKGAIRTIKENNILGCACGILCPAPDLCEAECSASGIDRPIEIAKIQRFLIEHAWEIGFEVFEKPTPRPEKVAIVGSGPAGLSCAAELAKAGVQVTVFEANDKPGGVLAHAVPNYRCPEWVVQNEVRDLETLGVNFVCSTPIKGEAAVEGLLNKGFDAVFLGSGCWASVDLREDQEAMPGLYSAVDFLGALRRGEYEAMREAIEGKQVAILGGGSVAMDCVGCAIKLGARDVFLVYRRSYTQMPAEKDERLTALHEGAHFILLNQPLEYIKSEDGKLTGIKLIRTKLGEPDASGRRKPDNIPQTEWTLDVDLVVEAFGYQPLPESSKWYPNVEVNNKGLAIIDQNTGRTSHPKIFAGGDIVRGPDLIINAIHDGKLAARSIMDLFNSKEG